MIHVVISLEYRSIPFSIEIDAQSPASLDLATLGGLLDQVKAFINKMLDGSK
jgi:hypothetical protein